jgi:hypothetical protein
MPEPQADNPLSAGISQSQAVDVEELVARLRDELRYGGLGEEGGERAADRRRALRALAERFKDVSAERPFQRRGGVLGVPQIVVKKVLRRLMRWYVEPLAAEQRIVNDVLLRLVDELCEQLDAEVARREEALRRLDELARRLPEPGAAPVSGRSGS